jgi:hypothetical protein
MATLQSSSRFHSPQDQRRKLAAKLADVCVNPSYMADLWGIYFQRFEEVLTAEKAGELPGNACCEPVAQHQWSISTSPSTLRRTSPDPRDGAIHIPSQPPKGPKAPKSTASSLQPAWRNLATLIVDRALLEQKLSTLPPPAAAMLRASPAAVELEKYEAALWQDLCFSIAHEVLAAPVTRWGADSRRPQLMPITQRRIRRLLAGFFGELIVAARRGFSE